MITEDYCSYEIAKMLKEKGFNEPIWTRYEDDNEVIFGDKYDWNNSPMDQISAPTLQMAMKWLREVYNIFIVIEPYSNTSCYFSLWEGDNYYENPLRKGFPSYGETVEQALKYCLKKIIK
jgi:hypothetical protein